MESSTGQKVGVVVLECEILTRVVNGGNERRKKKWEPWVGKWKVNDESFKREASFDVGGVNRGKAKK